MKIAVVFQHYYPEQFRLTPICEELVRRGHEVTVYTGLPNYPHSKVPQRYRWFRNRREEHNGVRIVRSFEIGRKPGKLGLALNYVSYTLSSMWRAFFVPKDFDVVFAYSTSPILMTLQGIILRKRAKKKMHMYLMDIWPACLSAMHVKESSLLYRLMGRVSRYVYRRCDSISYTSRSFRQYMWEVHGISLREQDYLPQFAETLFEQDAALPEGEGFHFVFAGNIGHMQSVDTILQAAHILKDEPIRWTILGDGSAFAACKALAERLELRNVEFLGRKPTEDMPEYYRMADAMLVTMRDDSLVNLTLPGKVQSYMAFAKPILGAINGETKRIVEEAQAGIICAAEDVQALADSVRRFMRMDADARLAMGQNARQYYDRNFQFADHINRLEQNLLDLCKGEGSYEETDFC